jgi:hypothetical protein
VRGSSEVVSAQAGCHLGSLNAWSVVRGSCHFPHRAAANAGTGFSLPLVCRFPRGRRDLRGHGITPGRRPAASSPRAGKAASGLRDSACPEFLHGIKRGVQTAAPLTLIFYGKPTDIYQAVRADCRPVEFVLAFATSGCRFNWPGAQALCPRPYRPSRVQANRGEPGCRMTGRTIVMVWKFAGLEDSVESVRLSRP